MELFNKLMIAVSALDPEPSKLFEIFSNGYSLSAIVSLLLAYGGWEIYKTLIKRLKAHLESPKDLNFSPLVDAPLIENRYAILLQYINHNKIRCGIRGILFKKILTVRCESHRNSLIEFIKEDHNKESHEAFKIKILKFLNLSNKSWMDELKNLYIPQSVIDIFFKNTESLKVFAEEYICSICDSVDVWGPNNIKTNMIVRFLLELETAIINNIELTLHQLNGEISMLSLDGIKCTNCTDDCQFSSHKIKLNYGFPKWVKRVLIVEDTSYMCNLFKSVLKRNSIDCVEARTASTALEALDNIQIDAAILDYYLNDGSCGSEVETPLRIGGIPYLYYTGSPDIREINTKAKILDKSNDINEALRQLAKICEQKTNG